MKDQYAIHETDEDRQRQREILRRFCAAKGVVFKATIDLQPYDASFYLTKHSVAEVKYRNHAYGTYPDYTIDRQKLREIAAIAVQENVYAILIVSWQGDIRYANISKPDGFRRSLQKRRDREEFADEVCHIPLEKFRCI